MKLMETLKNEARLLLNAELVPIQGSRFQPTGFADLGAATYWRPEKDGESPTAMLLVESAQSMANRLERTCLDGDGPDIDPQLTGLSYVKAKLTGERGEIWTSSLVEAHRMASPYFVGNREFKERLADEMKYDQRRPLDWVAIYRTIFKYDVNSLLHGVFLSLLDGGRVRCPRALTAFIEAEGVEEAHSGGVKNSPVDPTGRLEVTEQKFDKGVYSNVPYQRVEFTARKITAYFNLDLSLIRGYRLGEVAERLLVGMALLKIRRFFDSELRLRTACDLKLNGELRTIPAGIELPEAEVLLAGVKEAISGCEEAKLLASPAVTVLVTAIRLAEKKEKQVQEKEEEAG